MRLILVGFYSDGSNARHMKDDVLLEYSVGIGEGYNSDAHADSQERAINEMFAARKALRASSGSFGDYLILMEPDEEE